MDLDQVHKNWTLVLLLGFSGPEILLYLNIAKMSVKAENTKKRSVLEKCPLFWKVLLCQGDLTGQKRNLQQVLVSNMRNQNQMGQSPLQDVGE